MQDAQNFTDPDPEYLLSAHFSHVNNASVFFCLFSIPASPYLFSDFTGSLTKTVMLISIPVLMAVYMKSVLYPPTPNAPTPTLRERPPGCKTIFIGKIFFWQYWKDLGYIYSLHWTGSNLLLFTVHVPSASLLKIVAVPTFLNFRLVDTSAEMSFKGAQIDK